MTYEAQEISNNSGSPISFYEFIWGNTVWRYTGADRDIEIPVFDADQGEFVDTLFSAIAISDDGMVQGGSSNNDLVVNADATIPMTDLFQSTPPSGEIELTVYRTHDGDAEEEVYIAWKGYVSNVKRAEDNSHVNIVCRTFLASFERSGLRLAWARGCPHVLYDGECGVDPADYAVAATITALDGNSITVDSNGGNPDDWFTGGYVEWQANDDGTKDRRGIQASLASDQFRLLGTTYRLEVGMAVTLYPGCDLITDTCLNKFDNLANFGGCEQMSGENVFEDTPIL